MGIDGKSSSAGILIVTILSSMHIDDLDSKMTRLPDDTKIGRVIISESDKVLWKGT